MSSEERQPDAATEEEPDVEEVPVCLHCLEPVHPLEKVCPNCGEAVGQLTPYLPWESIRWEAGIWGRMWHQAWQRDYSWPTRILRLILIVWFVPVLLVALVPMLWRRTHQNGW